MVSVLKSHDNRLLSEMKKPIQILFCIEIIGTLWSVGEGLYTAFWQEPEITRPEPGDGNRTEEWIVEVQGEEEIVEVEITEASYTEEEANQWLEKAKHEIDDTFLGENTSLEAVRKPVILKDTYQEGRVRANWSFSPSNIIDLQGEIAYDEIAEGEVIEACCTLQCGTYKEIYTFPLEVQLPDIHSVGGIRFYLEKKLEELDAEDTKKIVLPEEIQGISIDWKPINSRKGMGLSILALVAGIATYIGKREEKKKEKRDMERRKRRDYPEIVTELALYTSAGISMKNSFQKIVDHYEAHGEQRAGYDEIVLAYREMEDGISEMRAYENLGIRTGIPEYKKLSLLIMQNLKRGSEGLVSALEKEEAEAFLMRENMARAAGEEASTKLLIPMMGLLMMVLFIMIVPAMMNIQV